jgi:hypothetical protein
MYPNLDFWLENKPSGNPGVDHVDSDETSATDKKLNAPNFEFLQCDQMGRIFNNERLFALGSFLLRIIMVGLIISH